MTDTEYLQEMYDLTIKLTDACNNFGLRSDAYNDVLKEIAASAARFNRSRCPHPLLPLCIFCVFCTLISVLVYLLILAIRFSGT